MKVENSIEVQYRVLASNLNYEFEDLYAFLNHKKLKEIFSTLHYKLIKSFELMNSRLPTHDFTAHFWADPSRDLLESIGVIDSLIRSLKNSEYAFSIDEYYQEIISSCKIFLSQSGGSEIPREMKKVELYYTIPIFNSLKTITITNSGINQISDLKMIGEGSYAIVYKFKDEFYQKNFALKRAKKDLSTKEIGRFQREYEQMNELNSPYIVDVFRYNIDNNEYIMEFMDYSLDEYLSINNGLISSNQRKSICNQILKAFYYIHAKKLLHRDISPKNILIKKYEDAVVVKIADFGLVRLPDSLLTSENTELKGYFNDPNLRLEGFNKYDIYHETYALTRILYFVLTGKTNTENIKNKILEEFVKKGLCSEKGKRFKDVQEIINFFSNNNFE